MKNKTFCILPWVHLATYTDGSGLLCCIAKQGDKETTNLNSNTVGEVRNSEYFKQARKTMLAGGEYDACSACYKEESAGLRSHRLHENRFWRDTLGQEHIDNLVENTKVDGSIDNDVYTVDFRLGNTCNLQCIMCRPQDSSKWYKEATILAGSLKTGARYEWQAKEKVDRDKFEWYKNPEFLQSFYAASGELRQMIFAGGEPLLIKEHKDIIKELVKRGVAKNIKVNYHTNGTIYDSELIELWKNFKRVDLFISLDGIERINNYVRYPALHKTVEVNLKKFNDNAPDNMHFKILCTVQALNIYYLPEFVEWLLSLNLPRIAKIQDSKDLTDIIHTGILHYPQYLSPKIFPERMKRNITRKLQSYKIENEGRLRVSSFDGLCELMNAEDHSHLQNQFNDYLENIDILHKFNKEEVFHELTTFGVFKKARPEIL